MKVSSLRKEPINKLVDKAKILAKKYTKPFIKDILLLVVLWIIIRGFLVVPFTVPSESMKGTLLAGDFIAVSKYPYGYNRNSFTFSMPLLGYSKRVFYKQPQRGDVIVFLLPSNPSIYYIKRVIGLPNERIQVKQGNVYINDKPIKKIRVEDYITTKKGKVSSIKQYKEILDNGVSYNILDMEPNNLLEVDNTGVYKVPPDHFFVMGDNRDNSMDSRYSNTVGFIPVENLIGRAEVVILSFKKALFPFKNRFFVSLRPKKIEDSKPNYTESYTESLS